MIYLDNFGHLFSDESLQELYDFAVKKLKFKPNWNHYSRHFPHFDILTEGKKWQAIRNGAIYLENATKSYKKIKEVEELYRKELYEKEWKIKNNKFFYESKGIHDQRILRINFSKLNIH